MKKVTLSLCLLLITIFTLFALVGCNQTEQATAYAQEQLTHAKDIAYVWIPVNSFSSNPDGKKTDKETINEFLQKFTSLEFSTIRKVSKTTFDKIQKGNFGVRQKDDYLRYITEQSMLSKFVINIQYENGVVGVILVDYDGTVYYVNNQDNKLICTKTNVLTPADCFK